MSAFIVDKVHIDLLVHTAINGPKGVDRNRWGTLRWWPFYDTHAALSNLGMDGFLAQKREAKPDTANMVGDMLVSANIASIRYHYPDAPDMIPDWARFPYRWNQGIPVTAVEGLKLVRCYEYQSCEHREWKFSEAKQFCDALTVALINQLPGYDATPWEWTERVIANRTVQSFARRAACAPEMDNPQEGSFLGGPVR